MGAHSGSLQPSCNPSNGNLPHPSRTIPYSLALANMRTMLRNLGYDAQKYGLHSSRRGAATHSAQIGIPDSEIQLSGGWQSAKSMKLYVDRKPKQFQRITNKLLEF